MPVPPSFTNFPEFMKYIHSVSHKMAVSISSYPLYYRAKTDEKNLNTDNTQA